MTLDDLKNKKIAFLGLGTNNQGLASYLKERKIAFDVLRDWESPEELTKSVLSYDVLFRSPGLPYLSEPIQKALQAGIEVYSQTKLFFDLCPAKIIGVTGTKGKGTTATLIYNILKAAGKRARLAGNIGQDPFEFIDNLTGDAWVVLELSSFQLQDLHKSPHIAVVLKTTSEHLDHHQDTSEYVEAKTNIVTHQTKDDFAVLNYDRETTRGFVDLTKASIWWNSTETTVSPGCYIEGSDIVLNSSAGKQVVVKVSDVGLIGRFNLENVTASVACSSLAGANKIEIIKKAIKEFKGLEHRLEFVRDLSGVKFYNDTFSSTPETTIAAISAFEEPIVLIVGGSEKGSDFKELGTKIATAKIKALLAVGKEGPRIVESAKSAGFQGKIYDSGLSDMEKIVGRANEISETGDVVLLSPAAASFDMFKNYKQRGELFKKFASRL